MYVAHCDMVVLCIIFDSRCLSSYLSSFFFNDTATTEIYTLSLHDALPISIDPPLQGEVPIPIHSPVFPLPAGEGRPGISSYLDRKSTRLNSSHSQISYAVFCLKKKKKKKKTKKNHTEETDTDRRTIRLYHR